MDEGGDEGGSESESGKVGSESDIFKEAVITTATPKDPYNVLAEYDSRTTNPAKPSGRSTVCGASPISPAALVFDSVCLFLCAL